ncbi:sigma-70 family RNA polymerase sigma factor [Nonomuraea sp. KC401]|uniref:sigma-70 family RNA polymerase sigma factor n=1 Tax=unclassified Nonomuraea TaxID=2593643 RepID=UPI0010FF12AE|nr:MULTISPECIES: sigma-70 family RNA polymerase sigma factor [unclassified Nonomuraea]NBE92837.1 sigma-70 family RNA polymerase sigma factor [Nonomuraea sp. K271]TLF81766.1 sigma-70 family RNA polymerase sigma factor [Nonomuraea sp. KC401]
MTDVELEHHRVALTGYCYRMLGSGFEAEDAVQETFVRAWQTYDPARGTLRTWLFHLATNVCLDMLRGPQRRARAMDLGPAATPGDALGQPLPHSRWIQPVPDAKVLDPAERAVTRETVRLAFVAALQHLPPRQRAVLILRDVLKWSAAETATLLSTTVTSVNSALQRARAKLPPAGQADETVDESLLTRYVSAFERYDVAALVSLLHEDATSEMPPFAWWLRGREHIHTVLTAAAASGQAPCEGSRLLPVRANGSPAFGQYLYGEPFALVVLDVAGGRIAGEATFLDPGLFPFFGLPMSFAAPLRTR